MVTGGNSGIGEAITDALSECGAHVAINFLTDPAAADAVAERARSRGCKALTLEADVSDSAAIEAMFAAMLSLLLRKHLIADWEFVEEYKKY